LVFLKKQEAEGKTTLHNEPSIHSAHYDHEASPSLAINNMEPLLNTTPGLVYYQIQTDITGLPTVTAQQNATTLLDHTNNTNNHNIEESAPEHPSPKLPSHGLIYIDKYPTSPHIPKQIFPSKNNSTDQSPNPIPPRSFYLPTTHNTYTGHNTST
jgi:hypothetical protein